MKKLLLLLSSVLVCFTYVSAQNKAGKTDTAQHQQYYSCQHHPEVSQNEPGKCPKCGMTLALSAKEQMQVKMSKNYTCPVHVDVFTHDPGKCPQCGKKLQLSHKEQMKSSVMKIYTCPMHPEVALDKEGKCPKCGAALEKKKSKL
jgi:transcription initiation factor IIE alpha subunit